MAGRIGRMGWRTFGECLRKKVIPISVETALHCQRVKNIVVQCGIDRAAITSQNSAQDGAARLGTITKVDIPLLIPDVVYRKASDSRDRCPWCRCRTCLRLQTSFQECQPTPARETREALPSTTPPVSAAPTWPKNLRRLALLAALLMEGFPVLVTSGTVFFSFIVIFGLIKCVRFREIVVLASKN